MSKLPTTIKQTFQRIIRFLKSLSWPKRIALSVLMAFVIYVLAGFLAVPLVVRYAVIGKIDRQLVGEFEADRVSFNPFTWQLSIKGLRGMDADGEIAASFHEFRVNLQPTSVFKDNFEISEVLLDQPQCSVRIDESGQLNLMSVFGLEELADKDEESEPFVIPSIVIKRLEVRDAQLKLELSHLDQPFERKVETLSFVMDDLRTESDHDNPYQFELLTSSDEKLVINGSLRLDPLSSTGRVSLEQVDLPDFSIFSGKSIPSEIGSGRLGLEINYAFRPLASRPEFGLQDGVFTLNEFTLVDAEDGKLQQGIESLSVEGIYLDVPGRAAGFESAEIDGGNLKLVRDVDGRVRLAGTDPTSNKKASKAGSHQPADSGQTNDPIALGVIAGDQDIGEALTESMKHLRELGGSHHQSGMKLAAEQITIRNSELHLRDESVTPLGSLGMVDIEMNAGPYRSDGSEILAFEISAGFLKPADGKLVAKGRTQATDWSEFTKFELTVKNANMPAFAGYLASAIGRPATSGTLSAQMNYSIDQGVLVGSNLVTIDKLALGDRVPDSEAPRLPLNLAITLLKDADGVIEIDLPVDGNVRQPNFSYARIVSNTVHNTITKVASTPFKMMSGLFPEGEGVQDNVIEFKAGSAEVPRAGKKIAPKLAKILESKPSLALLLTPSYDADEDSDPYSEVLFERLIESCTKQGESRKSAIKELHDKLPEEKQADGWGFGHARAMEKAVKDSIQPSQKDLEDLAEMRAKALKDLLIEEGIDQKHIRISTEVGQDASQVAITLEAADN